MRDHNCSLCEGSRHRYDTEKNRWVKCECLTAKDSMSRYDRAGVPKRFDDETWQTLVPSYRLKGVKKLVQEVARLKRGESSEGWFMVTGRPSRARDLIAALVLRTAVDGGHSAGRTDLPELITIEFGRGEEDQNDLVDRSVLVLYVGGEPAHKWNRHVMEKVIRKRWAKRQFLLLVAEVDPGRLASYYKSGIVQEALSQNFHRVHVGLKGEE